MVAGRQRRLLSVLAVLLVVMTAGGLINRFVLRAEWWQADHEVTRRPAIRLAEIGPPPGPVVPRWRMGTVVRRSGLPLYDQVAHALVQNQLVVVSGRGLDVRDARTGEARWHYSRSDWTLLGWAATKGHIVAYLERAGHRKDRVLAGFDAVSGRLLWRGSGDVPAATERSTLRWPAGLDIVLTTDDDRRSLHGRSAATGDRLWTVALPLGCELSETAANGSGGSETLAVLALGCGGRGRLLAVDPGTGRTRWNRELGSAGPPAVAVDGEVTVGFDGTALRVYNRIGAQIAVRHGDDLCAAMCPAVLSGDRLIVVHRQGGRTARHRMEAIDVSSGRVAWRRDVPDYAALTAAGDRLYALRPRLAENLLPAGIDTIALADGGTTTVPAPFVMGTAVDGVRPWLATAGGLLYVAVPEAAPQIGTGERRMLYPAGAARLIVLRGGPGGRGPEELGGVAAADWPDACDLLPDQEPAQEPAREPAREPTTVRPGGYDTTSERVGVGEVRLPHPVRCGYEPAGDKGAGGGEPGGEEPGGGEPGGKARSAAALTVTVGWVADSRESAAELFGAWRATEPSARELPDVGDEACELGRSGTIMVRVDRYIVAVNAYQTPGVAARLARVAAARLPS